MEKKEKLLRKFHIKDYTNQLEKILEKKSFSLDSKNLLLSMFYKIENAYHDYAKTKVEVYDKGDFLDRLMQIIQSDCNELLVAKFQSEAGEILEKEQKDFIVDKEKGRIIALGNDFLVLNCILAIHEKEICMPEEEENFQVPITYFLNTGIRMHETEAIRDFNGWSWDTILKDISNIELNLIFQNFLYLLGYDFIRQWIENRSKLADYLLLAEEKLKLEFGEEKAKQLIGLFCKLAIELEAKKDKAQKEKWIYLKKEITEEWKKLENKEEYLEYITKEKKKLTKEIEKIDKLINNKDLLKKEYEARNEKLPNKEKIFSIKHLMNRLEDERQELCKQMKQYNALIDPKTYVERKEKINQKMEFLGTLDLEQKEDKRKPIVELCSLFLNCLQIKIIKAKTKQELLSYFYILRYYRFIPFDQEGIVLKEVEKLQPSFEKTIRLLIKKAKQSSIIDEVTDDERMNEEIISKIFDLRLIDLNHLVIETRIENGKLVIGYYDTNILEKEAIIESDRTIKLKKKTKLFI